MTVKPLNLTLYLVLDPDLCSQSVGIVETALAAVQAGAGIVQLRAPTWKKRRMTECARALKSALTPFHVPLIIDDHADVMLAANADGLHVGQQDLTPADARQLIGSNRILGLSLGSLEDCRPDELALVDYVGIGPTFVTQSKPDAGAAIGLTALQSIAAKAQKPSVAIGGIHINNAAQVGAAGVNGIAVISAICGQPDPYAASVRLLKAFQSNRTPS